MFIIFSPYVGGFLLALIVCAIIDYSNKKD